MKFRVIIEQDEDGMYVVECPTLPGCVSQGRTRKEALSNIEDAIKGYLTSLKQHGDPIPPPVEEEVVEVTL
jgi:predicted RNase H-like HicB family nuclease